MKTTINVYLNFNGKCEQAMNFYKDCLGGDLTISKVAGSPVENEFPPEKKNDVMHSELKKGDLLLMASDGCAGEYQQGTVVSLSLNCATEEEIRNYFEKLSVGGEVAEPLTEQFWGALFGRITDKFGIKWLLNFDKTANA